MNAVLNGVVNHTDKPINRCALAEPCLADLAIETLDDARDLFRGLGDACRAMVKGRDEVIALVPATGDLGKAVAAACSRFHERMMSPLLDLTPPDINTLDQLPRPQG